MNKTTECLLPLVTLLFLRVTSTTSLPLIMSSFHTAKWWTWHKWSRVGDDHGDLGNASWKLCFGETHSFTQTPTRTHDQKGSTSGLAPINCSIFFYLLQHELCSEQRPVTVCGVLNECSAPVFPPPWTQTITTAACWSCRWEAAERLKLWPQWYGNLTSAINTVHTSYASHWVSLWEVFCLRGNDL